MLRKLPVFLLFWTIFTRTDLVQASAIFGYPHMQTSPMTLPQGRLMFGTYFAYGVTDFLQVGTNVVRDAFQFFNADAKLSLLDFEKLAFAPTFGFETYNYKNIADTNPDLRVTSFQPGAVAAIEIFKTLGLFVGGNLNYTSTKLTDDDGVKSGLIHGASFGSDIAWAYNPKPASRISSPKAPARKQKTADEDGEDAPAPVQRPKGLGNVFSAGVTYDVNYKLFGVGISHHWPGFQLGVHYYPNATKYGVVPIVAGGGVLDF